MTDNIINIATYKQTKKNTMEHGELNDVTVDEAIKNFKSYDTTDGVIITFDRGTEEVSVVSSFHCSHCLFKVLYTFLDQLTDEMIEEDK